MRVIHWSAGAQPLVERDSVVTLGNFDGVHRGHRALLHRVLEIRHGEAERGLITFDPHPMTIVAPDRAPKKLCSVAERLSRVETAGLDFTVVVPFTAAFAETEAEDFISELLVRQLRVKHVVVGPDCRFGKARRGDAQLLLALQSRYGYTVEEVPALHWENTQISSSTIRKAVTGGDLSKANGMLGAPYSLEGTVIPGRQEGRKLGFPTANLAVAHDRLLPALGVYAGTVHGAGDDALGCVVNVGTKPTFGDQEQIHVEVHLIGFTGDLYGQILRVELKSYLRPEIRFPSLEALKTQIETDVGNARIALVQ